MTPLYIAHRINTSAELKSVPAEYGVEIDIRDSGDKLILQHDPFSSGEELHEYLVHFRHRLLILNIKSEGIEPRVLECLKLHNIKEYFFLDSSFPMIYKLTSAGETQVAIRHSEYEGLDTIIAMKNRAKWVWVDCFSRLPISTETYAILKQAGFSLCLVSPELQKREHEIPAYKKQLSDLGIIFDAICTKLRNIPVWKG